MLLKQILMKLASDGGAWVSSNDCTEMEIADARATNRFIVYEGYGFVWRTGKWLKQKLQVKE